MENVISLTCPSCGARLQGSPASTTFKCQYCGNEGIALGEAGATLHGAFVRCPCCGRNDKAEKVSAIIASQTGNLREASTRVEVVIGLEGGPHSQTYEIPVAHNQTSVLANRLAPPAKPTGAPTPKIADAGELSLGVGLILVGVSVCVLPLYCTLLDLSNPSGKQSAMVWFLLGVIAVPFVSLPLVAIGGKVSSLGWDHYKVSQQQEADRERQEKLEVQRRLDRWERAVQRWNQVYYCYRDDCVFVPGETRFAPLSQMLDYLYNS